MCNSSVAHDYAQKQQTLSTEDRNNQVFCPMCELWHENNTLCQMSWSD
jgi:hypothetical protein